MIVTQNITISYNYILQSWFKIRQAVIKSYIKQRTQQVSKRYYIITLYWGL